MATRPFYGDPAANAKVWSKYAVLLGGVTATTPATNAAFTLNDPAATPSPIATEWDPVGALSEDNPFDDGAESITGTDHTAAGFGVYATTFSNQKEVVTFNAKETTLITLGIIYDGTSLTESSGTVSGVLKQRNPLKRYKVAFQRENGTEMERRISKNYATIDSLTKSFSNNETVVTVGLLIVPTSSKQLYDYYLGALA